MWVLVAVLVAVSGCGVRDAPQGAARPVASSWHDLPAGSLIGHRGGALLAPENTMAAFDRAAHLGVPIETDVRRLADGNLVLIHDDTVDRTTTSTGPVAALPTAAYTRLVCDASAWGPPGSTDTRLPTLADLLDRYGNHALLLLHIKDPAATVPLLDALEKHRIDPRSVVLESDLLTALAPATARGWDTSLLGGTDPVEAARQGVDWLSLDRASVTLARVAAAHAVGLRVEAWTVDDPTAKRSLFAIGADAVVTDDPRPLPPLPTM
jgi:glycerophosphoryl diester phosphodiesterase